MADTEGSDPLVDREALTKAVRRMLGSRGTEVVDWTQEPVVYQQVQQATGGILRLTGTALDGGQRRPWRLILKIARSPSAAPAGGVLAGSTDAGHLFYWKREAELFRDGVLDEVRGDFAVPVCYGVTEPDGDTVWVWLEEVEES